MTLEQMRKFAEKEADEIYAGLNLERERESFINGFMIALSKFREVDCIVNKIRTNSKGKDFVEQVTFNPPFMLPAKIFINQG